MELSYHQDVIYLGGSTSVEQGPHSSGIISACVFERNMPILAQKVFRKDDLRDCFSIKRLPRSDVIAVGGFQHLYLVQYSKKKFTSLFAFNNLHTGEFFTQKNFKKLKNFNFFPNFSQFFQCIFD